MFKKFTLASLIVLSVVATSLALADTHEGEQRSEYGKTEGIAGPVLIGPSMTLLGFPHPLQLGIEGKVRDRFGFALNYGFIPDINISDAKARIQALDARVRWFPFHGAFFVGMAFGTQTVTAQKSETIQGVNATATVDITSAFYTPQAGWRWVWPTGFFMGVDVGWQINSGANTNVSTDIRNNVLLLATPQYAQLESDVKKVGNDFGNRAIPNLTFLKFGWLF